MRHTAKVEVNIVSSAVIKKYAHDDLQDDSIDIVEQTLLDDERAREVVTAEAPPPTPELLNCEAKQALRDCADLCQETVVRYETLSRKDGPETIVGFAESRFGARWQMLYEMKKLSEEENAESDSVSVINGAPIPEDESLRVAVNTAVEKDNLLEQKLVSAFDLTAAPSWKAKIADWAARVQADRSRIAWLQSAFA